MSETKPDFQGAVDGDLLRYALAVADALQSVEAPESMVVDEVPIYWFGEVAGYIALSEGGGKTYDWVPVKLEEAK